MSEATKRQGGWIQTYTGRQFWPLDPRREDVDIRDIAHALGNLCRFTGHVRTFYSVAQHSVLCAQAASPEVAMLALLHDAAEAYMGDIARPWKSLLFVLPHPEALFEQIKTVEHRLLDVILAGLGVPPPSESHWGEVHQLDAMLLATEARDLMSPLHPDWTHGDHRRGHPVLPDGKSLVPWSPGAAASAFLYTYERLKKGKPLS